MEIKKGEVVAIIREVKSENVVPIVQVLIEEGIVSVEVSLSEEKMGLECIRAIAEHFGGRVNLGAGTVINEKLANKAIEAGAGYIITPGWDRDLVRYIKSRKVEVIPGVFTPSEVMHAVNEGIGLLKLFPAANAGLDYIKNLYGPFPDIRIMAVGGVTRANIKSFSGVGCYCFGIGSDLVPRGAGANELNRIRENAVEYVKLLEGGA